jgi:hypothetical protein
MAVGRSNRKARRDGQWCAVLTRQPASVTVTSQTPLRGVLERGTERRGVMANGALCSHANRPPLQSRRRPAAGVLERGDESGDLSGPIRKGEVARTREGDWQSLAVP